jgi:hypothetical protein
MATGIASDLDRHISGGIHANGLEAQVFISGFAEFPEQAFDGLGTVGRIMVRRHESAVLREQSCYLIVVGRC